MTSANPKNALTIAGLVENLPLREYLRNVRDWHGYVRFLGLPDRRDNPDVLIDRLFVEPLLTRRHVSPDEEPSSWIDDAKTIFDVLRLGRPTVLLGDPGTGKSTLLNYLVWLLARPTGDVWTEQVGSWLLPVPMVLRELSLRNVTSFDGLLNAFLTHPMSEPLRESGYLRSMIEEGSVLILLDGIDELGDPTARKNLRDAVFEGFDRHPRCRWLLSSRIVGYDEVPFDRKQDSHSVLSELPPEALKKAPHSESRKLLVQQGLADPLQTEREFEDGYVIIRYIAPFDDRRIEEFARNWYVQREAATIRAGEDATHLVRAVHADQAILRLARVPNLLTMMALIHRIEATLPHGRALLYGRIAEAYLESIDKFRGVYSSAYNLPQKRRWLARVGYEMQRRRSTDQAQTNSSDESELLVDSKDVLSWLQEEMRHGGGNSEDMSAEEFLDFVGRRSGLFLPRGEGRYAFVHLSFQEYFAAVALEREVTGLKWARGEETPLELNPDNLADWAGQSTWGETFSFLFELLAPKEDWHADLLDTVFGPDFSRLEENAHDDLAMNLARLLARLAINQRSGLTQKQDRAIIAAVRAELQHRQAGGNQPDSPNVFKVLLSDDPNRKILRFIGEESKKLNVQSLSLDFTQVSDLGPLADLRALERLDLWATQVSDLRPLADLRALERLDVSHTQVSDLRPLADLRTLESLDLEHTQVSDLRPLADLRALERLDVSHTQVSDLEPLADLRTLESLDLEHTQVSDLRPLADLRALERLDVSHTQVSDLRPLADLRALKYLDLEHTQVSDLRPLADLRALKYLNLWATQVSDLGLLANFRALEYLDLDHTQVSDLRPLAGLRALERLDVRYTQVSDLRPLADLRALKYLNLDHTQVSDLRPLADLRALKYLNLDHTQVSDLRPLADLRALRGLDVSHTQVSKRMVSELQDLLPECNILL